MKIAHAVHFTFDLELPPAEAVEFVRDVRRSLAKADFIRDMQVFSASEQTRVRAVLPVNAAFFGQQELTFESVLSHAARGAVLSPVALTEPKLGWAEVAGRAEVTGLETPGRPNGSRVVYDFDVTIHLNLPEPEKWGGRALLKMIHFTAQRVLENIAEDFPRAVQAAAAETEAEAHA